MCVQYRECLPFPVSVNTIAHDMVLSMWCVILYTCGCPPDLSPNKLLVMYNVSVCMCVSMANVFFYFSVENCYSTLCVYPIM